jgi:regulator of sirC expression with transglutaminase-like and TPR domain
MDAKELRKKITFHVHQMFGGIQEIFDQSEGWDTETAQQFQEYMIDMIQKTTENYSQSQAQERYDKAVEYWHEHIDDRWPPMDEYEKFLEIASGLKL